MAKEAVEGKNWTLNYIEREGDGGGGGGGAAVLEGGGGAHRHHKIFDSTASKFCGI